VARGFGFVALVTILALSGGVPRTAAPPALASANGAFTVDGRPRFLLLVSYFDALRASDATLAADFAWLRRHGLDGVRIFPNWWRCAAPRRCGGHPGDDTLCAPDGQVRPARLARLRQVLAAAAEHRLVVDLSFARETVVDGAGQPMPAQAYADAIATTLAALGGSVPHVMVDLQNEADHNPVFARDAAGDAAAIGVLAKRLAGGARMVFASTGEARAALLVGCGRAEGCGAGARAPDVVAVHDARVPDWAARTTFVVRTLQGVAGGRPIYLQEPQAWQDEPPAVRRVRFHDAAARARHAGAAAWTFHTRSAFVLRQGRSLTGQLDPDERAAIEGLRAAVDRTP
jgi:hypothetical protein